MLMDKESKRNKMDDPQQEKREVEEQLLKNNVIQTEDLTLLQKIKTLKSNITVEPALGFFVMPSVLQLLATQNLILDKACRVNLNYTDTICTALRKRTNADYKQEEINVNELIGNLYAWKEFVHTVVPTILMLFLGAWSDKTGRRKICILMPILGEILSSFMHLVNTYFFYEISLKWGVMIEVFLSSLGGGWYTMFLGTYSYICDITPKSTRTFRLGVLNLCMNIGLPTGMALSGVVLRYLGYYGVFAMSGIIQLFNFLYVLFYIKDQWIENQETKAITGCKKITSSLKNFFDFKSLKDTCDVVFKKGPNNRRLKLCLILFLVCLNFGQIWGEISIKYFYTRYKFHWDEVNYSIYATYNFFTHSIGTLFAISVFTKKLGVDDACLGIIASSSKICGALMFAFAGNGNQAFLAPLLSILDGPSTIAERSMASKLVYPHELGKIYSFFGLAETTMRLIFAPLYSTLFSATLQTLPGAVYLLSVALTVPALLVFIWFHWQYKNDKKGPTPILDNKSIPMNESA